MSFYYTQTFASTGAIHIYQLKEALKSAGWTVPSSSDGTTYNASGDEITSGASGANGLANNSAWFIMKSPLTDGYQKSICFQRGTANQNWRIKYSFSAGFSGGSPGATQTPSATDEQVILGGGTNASPTFSSFLTTDAAYRSIFIIGDSSEFYSIYCFTFPLGGGAVSSSLIFQPITSESKNILDPERHLIGATNANLFSISALSNTASCMYSWFRKDLSGESFVRCPGFFYQSNSSNWHSSLSTSLINAKIVLLPIVFGRLTSYSGNAGIKGIGKNIFICNFSTNTPTTFSYQLNKDYLIVGNLAIPWNNEGVIV